VTRVELPVKDQLRDPAEGSALNRIWNQIDGRALAARRRRRRVSLGGVVLATCAGLAVATFVRRDAGPLRLADGRALVAVDAVGAETRVALSDGSALELGAGARFEPLESTGTTFIGVLQRGRAAFDVRPGGPRRWQIECGLATVEVVGTRFSCDRAPGRLRVAVEHGVVLVRGERVPDRARRLGAGEAIEVVAGAESVVEAEQAGRTTLTTTSGAAPTDDVPLAPVGDAPEGATTTTAGHTVPWRELARRGRHDEAFVALGAQGVRRETQRLGVSDLLALADVARLSGHPREAVAPLERILSAFAHDPQAPLAAFALARLELDALDRPRRAETALERALALGTPQSLREDVRARLVEARDRAGERASARLAARAYLREFPVGRYRNEMETRLQAN
jgi:transmembrane sensor